MNKIKFLGVGGGDIGMIFQLVPTSCIYAEMDDLKFLIDPGPGTLINARIHGVNITEINGIFLSHLHPDHSNDVNVVLTTVNTNNPSFLIAEEHCLMPSDKYFPCVSKWHQSIPEKLVPVEAGEYTEIGKLKIKAIACKHFDPCVGFVIKGSRTIGYLGDGTYYQGQEDEYKDCDVLIFNVLGPYGTKTPDFLHTCVDDVITILEKIKPQIALITHYSYQMLQKNPIEQAKIIEEKTGVKTIATLPGMEINLDTFEINIKKKGDDE